jgi:hypothetical protein
MYVYSNGNMQMYHLIETLQILYPSIINPILGHIMSGTSVHIGPVKIVKMFNLSKPFK